MALRCQKAILLILFPEKRSFIVLPKLKSGSNVLVCYYKEKKNNLVEHLGKTLFNFVLIKRTYFYFLSILIISLPQCGSSSD